MDQICYWAICIAGMQNRTQHSLFNNTSLIYNRAILYFMYFVCMVVLERTFFPINTVGEAYMPGRIIYRLHQLYNKDSIIIWNGRRELMRKELWYTSKWWRINIVLGLICKVWHNSENHNNIPYSLFWKQYPIHCFENNILLLAFRKWWWQCYIGVWCGECFVISEDHSTGWTWTEGGCPSTSSTLFD